MDCYICEKSISPKLILKNKNNAGDINRCEYCKISFVNPQPSPEVLNDYYNGMYLNITNSYDNQKMQWARRSMKHYIKEVGIPTEELKNKTFLDLGGGLGYYAKAAEELGLKSILVETDEISIAFARQKLSINSIKEQNLHQFFSSNNNLKYDIVFLRHVIEHVTDPSPIIENISNILKEEGTLIIETDNNSGIELLLRPSTAFFYLKLYKKAFKNVSYHNLIMKRPFALDPPRHLFAFRMSNLSFLLNKHSISPYKKIHYRLGHPIYWPNLPMPTLNSFVRDLLHLKLKDAIIKLLEYLFFIPRIILEFLGLSSGLCIYAKKIPSNK